MKKKILPNPFHIAYSGSLPTGECFKIERNAIPPFRDLKSSLCTRARYYTIIMTRINVLVGSIQRKLCILFHQGLSRKHPNILTGSYTSKSDVYFPATRFWRDFIHQNVMYTIPPRFSGGIVYIIKRCIQSPKAKIFWRDCIHHKTM